MHVCTKLNKLHESHEDQIGSLALFLALGAIPYCVLGRLEIYPLKYQTLLHFADPLSRSARRSFGPCRNRAKINRGPIRYEVCSGYRLQCTRQSFKLSKEKPSNRLARVAPVNQLNSLSLSLRICENMRRACRQNESKCDQLQHISNKTKALLWDLELVT